MLSSLRLVVRVTAIVLLAWTAVDLGYPQCCLRELLPAAADLTFASPSNTTSESQSDVDDCFCCARCLDTGTRIPLLQVSSALLSDTEVTHHLATRPARLDHPPQNA